ATEAASAGSGTTTACAQQTAKQPTQVTQAALPARGTTALLALRALTGAQQLFK
ncbi:hypothetical protein GVN25_22100, partial [Pseudomonas sp. BC115LW]|nr:hypothetical protein [Pseudomonas sp. BC115LW]